MKKKTKKKKRSKIYKYRRIILLLFAIGIAGGIIYLKNNIFAPINFEDIEVPEYVEEMILTGPSRNHLKLNEVNNIVIHYVGNPESTAKQNHDYFNKLSTTVNSHFLIGLDGEVIQNIPLCERSCASNNRNKDTISIEVCHPDESGKFNKYTEDSLIKLTAWLCKTFRLKSTDVIRHYDVTGKICPKYYVENNEAWEDFKIAVEKEMKEQ